jgi:hypothetical protein
LRLQVAVQNSMRVTIQKAGRELVSEPLGKRHEDNEHMTSRDEGEEHVVYRQVTERRDYVNQCGCNTRSERIAPARVTTTKLERNFEVVAYLDSIQRHGIAVLVPEFHVAF